MRISQADTQAGFTLVELLAVLVIIALAATAVRQGGGYGMETAKFRAFLISSQALMREVRTVAIETMHPQEVVLDAEERNLSFEAGKKIIKVPAGVSLEGELARLEGTAAGKSIIRFFPDGTSTGANLAFGFREQVYELRVIWLTGRADVRRI